MMRALLLLIVVVMVVHVRGFASHARGSSRRTARSVEVQMKEELKYDSQGYLIKPRDWFNGLSADPGNSLADPRAVPKVCKDFAEKVKGGWSPTTFAETLALIDEHYTYFSVPFTNGDVANKGGENTGSAKVFSFALMTKMDEKAALRLFAEIYRDLKPEGTDHANIRAFIKTGFSGVSFPTGLAIASKLQAGDSTDEVFDTQAKIEGESGWTADSDSWIP